MSQETEHETELQIGEMQGMRFIETKLPPMPPEIAKAVVTVKRTIERLAKDSKNPHGRYNYTSVDDFFEAVGHPMAEAGIFTLVIEKGTRVVEQKSTDDNGRSRVSNWLEYNADIWIFHESGVQFGPIERTMRVVASGPQAYGSAPSYIEKYFLRQLFKIPTGDVDADDHDKRGLPQGDERPPKVVRYTPENSAIIRDAILKELADCGTDKRNIEFWLQRNDHHGYKMVEADKEAVSDAYAKAAQAAGIEIK